MQVITGYGAQDGIGATSHDWNHFNEGAVTPKDYGYRTVRFILRGESGEELAHEFSTSGEPCMYDVEHPERKPGNVADILEPVIRVECEGGRGSIPDHVRHIGPVIAALPTEHEGEWAVACLRPDVIAEGHGETRAYGTQLTRHNGEAWADCGAGDYDLTKADAVADVIRRSGALDRLEREIEMKRSHVRIALDDRRGGFSVNYTKADVQALFMELRGMVYAWGYVTKTWAYPSGTAPTREFLSIVAYKFLFDLTDLQRQVDNC